jgi:hypothetical protein
MKKIAIIISFLFIFNSWAECNPRTIKQVDGKFLYPVECHIEFGKLRQTESDRKQQIYHLEKTIKLKDLAINLAEEKAENWKSTSYKLEEKILKYEKNSERTKWIYFGLGILVMGGAVYGASQIK